jgi:hypothetical protein
MKTHRSNVLLRRPPPIQSVVRPCLKAPIPSPQSELRPLFNAPDLLMGSSIVFVHGLRGHRTQTWTKDGVCWPKDLLPKEEALSHVRVLSFGYDAGVVSLTRRASLNTLFDHSINLLNELARVRARGAVRSLPFQAARPTLKSFLQQDRPLIFIAHSLGGLIVKDVRFVNLFTHAFLTSNFCCRHLISRTGFKGHCLISPPSSHAREA